MSEADSILSELKELRGKIIFRVPNGTYVSPFADDETRQLRLWTQHFGLLRPKAVYQALSRNLGETQIGLPVESPSNIYLHQRDGANQCEILMETSVPLDSTQYFNIINVNVSPQQGISTGKKALANLLDFAQTQAPNIVSINLDTDAIGGYAWAKFGFTPGEADWQELTKLLGQKHQKVAAQLTSDENGAITRMLACGDPHIAWVLSDLAKPVVDPANSERKSLGKYLLLDTKWLGSLHLNDSSAIQRFKGYIEKLSLPLRPASAVTAGVSY